jgi:hypothetical protein
MSLARALMTAIITMALSGTASAAVVMYNFSGIRNNSSIVGTDYTFSGSLTYDSSVPVYYANHDSGNYRAVSSITFQTGFLSGTATPKVGLGPIQIINSYLDWFDASADNNNSNITGNITSVLIRLTDNSGTVFNSTALPSALNLSNFNNKAFQIIVGGTQYNGAITSFTPATISTPTALPEPTVWAMLVGGFGLVGAALRYRRQDAAPELCVRKCY